MTREMLYEPLPTSVFLTKPLRDKSVRSLVEMKDACAFKGRFIGADLAACGPMFNPHLIRRPLSAAQHSAPSVSH
jgi:hypothetical protein